MTSNSERQAVIEAFLTAHPDVTRIELLLCDQNGVWRGKWLPRASAPKLWSDGLRMPVSTSGLDIWGEDVDGSGLGIDSGDKDTVALADPATLCVVPWSEGAAQIVIELEARGGGPSLYDPRALLRQMQARLSAKGMTPVVASELEFYIHKPRADEYERPQPPKFASASHLYDYVQLDANAPFLEAVQSAAKLQNIPVDVVQAESGRGQFEINFNHVDDALSAADHGALFKRLVRGVARQHGLEATFMAKPFDDEAGSGCHVHISLLDAAGDNLFAATDGIKGGNKGGIKDSISPHLRHALGGLLASMPDAQAIFAPHFNSYRRYDPEWFAPTKANWGHDNRSAALRIPATTGKAARLEHRLCGADVNPYLTLAAMLGGILWGIEAQLEPCAPLDEDPHATGGDLAYDWPVVVETFANSAFIRDAFGADFQHVYGIVKRYEAARFKAMVTDVEYRTYLGRI